MIQIFSLQTVPYLQISRSTITSPVLCITCPCHKSQVRIAFYKSITMSVSMSRNCCHEHCASFDKRTLDWSRERSVSSSRPRGLCWKSQSPITTSSFTVNFGPATVQYRSTVLVSLREGNSLLSQQAVQCEMTKRWSSAQYLKCWKAVAWPRSNHKFDSVLLIFRKDT